MNNFNENAAQQVGQNAKSLQVVNKAKYLNKQIPTQELALPNPQKSIVLDGYECVVCKCSTIMYMHMIACMRNYKSSTNYNVSRRTSIPSQRQICGANFSVSRRTAIPSQRQICGANTASDMAMVPSMGIVPCIESDINLCCAHCDLYFDNEEQVLKHGHIVQFKRNYNIKSNS